VQKCVECVYDCNCQSCTRRFHAWQEFDYVCQLLVRNKEVAQPSPAKDAGPSSGKQHDNGPKVDTVIRDRVQRAISHGWKGLVEEYNADAALRYKADLDRGPSVPAPRVLGEPPSPQDADAFCRNARTMQSGAAASAITGAVLLPDTPRLRETLRTNIRPADDHPEIEAELLQLRLSRLREMQDRLTPDIINALDNSLAKQAAQLKPHKKSGRTGWRNEFIRAMHETRAGPSLRRMAIHFVTGRAPLRVYRRYGIIQLGPRDKGSGEEDPRPVGAPEPFWRWSVRAAKKGC